MIHLTIALCIHKCLLQILSFESNSSSPIFRHFYQVSLSRQNLVNRKDGVGLLLRFSGVHGNSCADENWEEVVVVEQHGILIGCYRALSWIETDLQYNEVRQICSLKLPLGQFEISVEAKAVHYYKYDIHNVPEKVHGSHLSTRLIHSTTIYSTLKYAPDITQIRTLAPAL